jgi:hypothetical protein
VTGTGSHPAIQIDDDDSDSSDSAQINWGVKLFRGKSTHFLISDISWRSVLVVEKVGEPPTMGKQLVNFITCGCESSAPFFVIYKAGREGLRSG